jgi:hypothetical protein
MPRVQEALAGGHHLRSVGAPELGVPRQQTQVALAGHIERVTSRAAHGATVANERRAAVRAAQEVEDVVEHGARVGRLDRIAAMGKRSRRRARSGGASPDPPATTTDYLDAEGNVLTLRDELSAGTLRKLDDLDAKPAASSEDRSQRRSEFLFERLVVRWEIAGLPLEGQKELLGRYRLASSDERQQVRRTLAEHLSQRHPDVSIRRDVNST